MKPAGSNATIQNSPLLATMPVFEPSDQLVAQAAGRALLRPDVLGDYTVQAIITTKSNGNATVAQTIFGATYAGISECSKCHDGEFTSLNKVATWSQTAHASIFKQGINGVNGATYPSTCYSCHTVGDDANATVPNGGFATIAAQLGWKPPTTLAPGQLGCCRRPRCRMSRTFSAKTVMVPGACTRSPAEHRLRSAFQPKAAPASNVTTLRLITSKAPNGRIRCTP